MARWSLAQQPAVPSGVEVRRIGLALEHHQLPLRTTLVEAQNVQITVVAFDLEVAIVWSIPLIDVFDDFDGASSSRFLVAPGSRGPSARARSVTGVLAAKTGAAARTGSCLVLVERTTGRAFKSRGAK
jgi:hypothetical protein